MRSAEMDAGQIQVRVKGSMVTLSGTVRSWAEKQAAVDTARVAPGITAVDNRIGTHRALP